MIKSFYNNLHVKWNPNLIRHPNPRDYTASHGGDLMPERKVRDKLLKEAMDSYDEDEEKPTENHDTHFAIEVVNSILKKDGDIPEMADELLVEREDKENSLGLYFDWKPMSLKSDIEILKWEGKKHYHDMRNDNTYQPSRIQQYIKEENKNVKFQRGLKSTKIDTSNNYKSRLRECKE